MPRPPVQCELGTRPRRTRTEDVRAATLRQPPAVRRPSTRPSHQQVEKGSRNEAAERWLVEQPSPRRRTMRQRISCRWRPYSPRRFPEKPGRFTSNARVQLSRQAGETSEHESLVTALERAGIVDFRWHDLRHTWASWHVQNGTQLFELQELGGWESPEMVRRFRAWLRIIWRPMRIASVPYVPSGPRRRSRSTMTTITSENVNATASITGLLVVPATPPW